MPGRFSKGTIACVAVLLTIAAAHAQGKPPASTPSPPPLPAAHEPPPSAQNGTPAMVVDLQAMDGLIGKSVKSAAGDDMGRLIDLIVGTNGEIRAAIIDFGGVLGVGSRKVAVDWHALNFADSAKGGPIKVGLTRDALRVAPEYRSGEPIVILQAPVVPTPAAPPPPKSDVAGRQPPGPPSAAAPAAPPPVVPATTPTPAPANPATPAPK